MKSKLTKFIKRVCYLLIFLFIGIFCTFQYLRYDFNKNLDKESFENVILEIQKATPLPEKFVTLYEQIHPITTVNGLHYEHLRGIYNEKECPCLNTARMTFLYVPNQSFTKNRYQLGKYFYAKKLEKRVSQQACLNFNLSIFGFLFNTKGIQEASKYYFDKEPAALNEEEMITIIIMLQNPRRYNPKRSVSKKTLATKIAEIKEKITNQKEH